MRPSAPQFRRVSFLALLFLGGAWVHSASGAALPSRDPASPRPPPAPAAVAPPASQPTPIRDLRALRKAITRYYSAEQEGDWATMYGMIAPLIADEAGTLEEFVAQGAAEATRLVSWTLVRIDPPEGSIDFAELSPTDPTDPAFGVKVDSVAGALMDVTYLTSDGKRERLPSQVDIWVRVDGRWLWTWREKKPEER